VLNATTDVSTATTINKEFEYNFKGKVWKPKHCSMIIVIINALTGVHTD